MSWWKPVVLLIVPPLVVVLLQILLYPFVDSIEGNEPLAPVLTPLRLLAVNLTEVASALLTILLLARMSGAPWRSLISAPRAFDARRLAQYLVGAALLVGCRDRYPGARRARHHRLDHLRDHRHDGRPPGGHSADHPAAGRR